MIEKIDDTVIVPRYLTAEQCAIRFAISLRHFKYLVASGEMPQPVKFGKSSRWSIDMLEFYEAEKQEQQVFVKRKTSRPKNSRRFFGSAR